MRLENKISKNACKYCNIKIQVYTYDNFNIFTLLSEQCSLQFCENLHVYTSKTRYMWGLDILLLRENQMTTS